MVKWIDPSDDTYYTWSLYIPRGPELMEIWCVANGTTEVYSALFIQGSPDSRWVESSVMVDSIPKEYLSRLMSKLTPAEIIQLRKLGKCGIIKHE